MSYLELLLIKSDGTTESYTEYQNAWLGAMNIWQYIGKRNFNDEMTIIKDAQKIWDIYYDPNIHNNVRLVLGSTFDNMAIEFNRLHDFGNALYHISQMMLFDSWELGHISQLKKDIADIADIWLNYKYQDYLGICFHQTSVSCDQWYNYDFSQDSKHRWLFESFNNQ